MSENHRDVCVDCGAGLDRRKFLGLVGGAAVGLSASGLVVPRASWGAPTPKSAAETDVTRLYATLSESQKAAICLPFDDAKRTRISANWQITKPTIGSSFFSAEQRTLIDSIFRGVTSPEGYEKLKEQMEQDSGGFGEYAIAIFGTPGNGKFQWELTGRHLTLRADGDSVENMAFGGPIVYGHGEETPASNLFHYQTKQVNEVFAALDGKQREVALLSQAPRESNVPLQGKAGTFPGIKVGDLSTDQQGLVNQVLKVLLAPYRQEDVEEVMADLNAGGGLQALHMAFYQQGDLDNDKVWDIWRVEGPNFVWHFRGAPHVHAYIHIGVKA